MTDFEDTPQTFSVRPSVVALCITYLKVVLPLLLVQIIIVYTTTTLFRYRFTVIYKVICILWLLEMVRRYYNDLYTLTPTDITHFGGRLSFRYNRMTLKYVDIRESRVYQTILGRIFNYGTLSLSTAATGFEEMFCRNIGNPQALATYIQKVIIDLKKITPANTIVKEKKT